MNFIARLQDDIQSFSIVKRRWVPMGAVNLIIFVVLFGLICQAPRDTDFDCALFSICVLPPWRIYQKIHSSPTSKSDQTIVGQYEAFVYPPFGGEIQQIIVSLKSFAFQRQSISIKRATAFATSSN